jgi:hypothetical protein
MGFMDRVTPIVDETIRILAKTKFVEDPIAGVKYSRATSIVSSAYKRHGRILETALRESLRESNRHHVWQDDAFKVSRAADALVGSAVQVDMISFDDADQTIRAYEVKRGNGQFDVGKIRSIKRDIMCIQVLLKSYGETANYKPISAESRIIFYYGVRSIPRPWLLVRNELDNHFGFPVVA